MTTNSRRNLCFFVASSIVIAVASTTANAKEKGLPVVKTESLRDIDISNEIKEPAEPNALTTLKPRPIPGYEQLRNAFWSGRRHGPAALLANGADPNATSKDGEPIIRYAVWNKRADQLEDLLRAGADPNRQDQKGNTPLTEAIWGGDEKIVELLLKYGADPNHKRKDGTTELDYARWHEKPNIIALVAAKRAETIKTMRITPPPVLRQPDQVFGSARFRAAGGGQALVYTADSKQLIAGDERGGIRFFDAKTGDLRHVINAHDYAITSLALIPNSSILVSSGDDRTTRFWDMETSRELKRLRWNGHGISASPDGRLLYTGYHIWEIESVKPLKLASRGRTLKLANVNSSSCWSFFTPESRYLVIGLEASAICVWDLAKDQIHKFKDFNAAATKTIQWKDLATAVDIGKQKPEELLALGSDQYTVVTAAPEVLTAFAKSVESFTNHVRAMACSPDGQYLSTLGYDSRIDVYDLENKKRKYEHTGHTAAVLAVSASPDGKLIASGGNDMTVRIWDRKTSKQIAEIPTKSFVYSVCFSPNGKVLAIGDDASGLYLWDVKDQTLQTYSTSGRVTDLAFDARGKALVSLGHEIHVFDVKARNTLVTANPINGGQSTITLSPDGLLVSGTLAMGANETFKVPYAWKLDGDTLTEKKGLFSEAMGHRSFIESVEFSPDGSLLASSSEGAIRLWDMKKSKLVGQTMCGHNNSALDLKFSKDGKWLASASWDGTARVWEIPSGRQAFVLEADVDRVSCVDFTPDGQLVTANWDGTVHLWDLRKHRAAIEKK
jgi:WD40 repeat protein